MNTLLAALLAAGFAPSEVPPAPAPAVQGAPAPDRPAAAGLNRVSGGGYVSGWAHARCWSGGGHESVYVTFRGDVEVRGADGATGRVPVSGSFFMSGMCSGSSVHLTGSGEISGTGPVYGSDGRPLGTARVSGHLLAQSFGSGSMYISKYVDVSGTY